MNPSKNVGMEVGTSGGDWLFRQGELVLGPIPAAQIVQRLYAGELDGRTEIAPVGSSGFRRLGDVDFFKLHLAKAEAKKRVDHLAVAEASSRRKKRNLKIAATVVVCLIAAAGVARLAQYLAVHSFWKDADDPFGDIEMSPPVIALASARGADEDELVYYPGATPAKPSRPSSTETAAKPETPKPTRVAKADRPSRPRSGMVQTDEDGMQTAQFDQAAINSVVASNQRSLYPCIRAEAERKPGLSAQIPIEFVIGNDGRVSKVWVDNATFKDGPLQECLFRALQKWPFKAYEGERATVQLKFKVGKG